MTTKNATVKEKSVKANSKQKLANNPEEKKEQNFKPKNSVMLTGNIGNQPTIRDTKSGGKRAFFTMATNSRHWKAGEEVIETLWHSLVAWGTLAEKVEAAVNEGDRISVTGRINNRRYTDANGVSKMFTEIVLQSLDVLHSKQSVAAV
jgi:single-strand DNA-binding protein